MQGQSVRQWLMVESEVDPAYCDDLPQLTIPDFTAENHLANHSVHALCYQSGEDTYQWYIGIKKHHH